MADMFRDEDTAVTAVGLEFRLRQTFEQMRRIAHRIKRGDKAHREYLRLATEHRVVPIILQIMMDLNPVEFAPVQRMNPMVIWEVYAGLQKRTETKVDLFDLLKNLNKNLRYKKFFSN